MWVIKYGRIINGMIINKCKKIYGRKVNSSKLWLAISSIIRRSLKLRTIPRFIAGIKGRDGIKGRGGVQDAKSKLRLTPRPKRRRSQRLSLLMFILAWEEHHFSLSQSYNEIMSHPMRTMTTSSQMRGISATFWTNNTQFHNSCLPHIIRGKVKMNKL